MDVEILCFTKKCSYQLKFLSLLIFFSTIYSSEESSYKNKIVFINGNPITQINSKNIKLPINTIICI